MHKKFEINRTKIKGGCQSGRKVVTHNSKSDLPLYTVSAHIEARASIFRSGFLGGPLIKFIIPGLLIKLGFY